MDLPETVRLLIDEKLNRSETGEFAQLIRRKGQLPVQEMPYSLASDEETKELLEEWNTFGVLVSMLSFWLINCTPFALSVAVKSSKSRVFLAKREILSTVRLSPSRTKSIILCSSGRSVFFPLILSV